MTILQLIQTHARELAIDFMGEPAPPLYAAIADAVDEAEARALAVALCARYDATCGEDWRIGSDRSEPRIQAIADAIGYR